MIRIGSVTTLLAVLFACGGSNLNNAPDKVFDSDLPEDDDTEDTDAGDDDDDDDTDTDDTDTDTDLGSCATADVYANCVVTMNYEGWDYVWTYDALGLVQTLDVSSTLWAGTYEQYEYDTRDRLVDYFVDDDINGFFDNLHVNFSWQDCLEDTQSFDEDGDGTYDQVETSVYDPMGRLYTITGSPNPYVATYSYDSNGYLVRRTFDGTGNGLGDVGDSDILYVNDAAGNPIQTTVDLDFDGTIDIVIDSTYDANGNLLTDSQDDYDDGVYELVTTYTYDSDGRMTYQGLDYFDDGVMDEEYLFINTCP